MGFDEGLQRTEERILEPLKKTLKYLGRILEIWRNWEKLGKILRITRKDISTAAESSWVGSFRDLEEGIFLNWKGNW